MKPEFPQSESMGRVSREARLCFILLWTQADDSGTLRGNSRMLASLLYPYDDDSKELVPVWLQELSIENCIEIHEVAGDRYIRICNWLKHQKIDKPSKSRFPDLSESSRILDESSRKIALDQGSRIKDHSISSEPETLPALQATHPNFQDKLANEIIQATYRHYVFSTNREPKLYVLTDIRKKKALARLQECLKRTGGDYDAAAKLLRIAVENLAASDWHMGRDPKTNGKKYCDWIDHLFKSYETLEKWWQ